jgi:hypothetical protein
MQLNPTGFKPGMIYTQMMENYTIITTKLFQEVQALKAQQSQAVELQK